MVFSRRTLIISGLLLIVITIPLTVLLLRGNLDFRKQASQDGASFSFDPSSGTIANGSAFEINILINTGVKRITGADLAVAFDPDALSVVDNDPDSDGVQVIAGSFFEKPLVLANQVQEGKILLSINSFTPFQGGGIFGTLKFKAKKAGDVKLEMVEGETKITEQGTGQNIIAATNTADFAVEGDGQDQNPTEATSDNTPLAEAEEETVEAPTLPGDIDGSGKVDELDLQVFAKKWGTRDDIADVDFNQDGQIDELDLQVFAKNYNKSL